jgi:hypothetical protein
MLAAYRSSRLATSGTRPWLNVRIFQTARNASNYFSRVWRMSWSNLVDILGYSAGGGVELRLALLAQ